MRMIILSFQVALFQFSAWASSVDSQLKCRHAVLYVSSCYKELKRQHLILLIVSDTYSNKAAYAWCISPCLPFKCTLTRCFTFFPAFWFSAVILLALRQRSVILAQLPNQVSQKHFSLRQHDSPPLPLVIGTLSSHMQKKRCLIHLLHFQCSS